ncbi:hypothetical protein [Chondromyces apiculatus]|uniref:Uncharacterized protein n=1 Tax=Chondromyces apiculatus DSM 436 TaxID=1192034 RepID=A0A017T0V1_9BACT|nr:hypothetical protein [Chondromyces apiculatus]EYF02480.1 Hypothetical protein CAP_7102 [Chondromyces apiculatus DSM 436]
MFDFHGPERRRHRVFVTRNTEYHVRDGICVAVRDREGSGFRASHIAINLRLEGAVRSGPHGLPMPDCDGPRVGASIYFTREDTDGHEQHIVTSRIERIERPEKRIVLTYPAPAGKRASAQRKTLS